jgi:hypothetical protein
MLGFGTWLTQGSLFRPAAPAFAESKSRAVHGTAFPYLVDIPESWIERLLSAPGLEHEFAKPGVGKIKILAHAGAEDISRLPETLVENSKQQMGPLGRDVAVEMVQPTTIGDRSCAQIRLRNVFRTGAVEFQRLVAYSGADGTFLINVIAIAEIEPAQQAEIDRILGSVRFSRTQAEVQRAKADAVVREFRQAPDSEIDVLRGKAVPYELRVPRGWKVTAKEDPLVEHARQTPSGGGLFVIANPQAEDISNVAAELVAAVQSELGDDTKVTLHSQQQIQVDGIESTCVTLNARMADGLVVVIDHVIYAGGSGTLIVRSILADKPETQTERLVMHEVLRSVRLQAPVAGPVSESRVPEPRASKKRASKKRGSKKRASKQNM